AMQSALRSQVEASRQEADAKERAQREDEERRQLIEAERLRAANEQAQVVRSLAEGLSMIADGDLTFRLSDGFTGTYLQIKDDFNKTVARLAQTIDLIAKSTHEVSTAASEIAHSSEDLSHRTGEQAESIEETTAAMDELAATVKRNADSAQKASKLASSTRDVT